MARSFQITGECMVLVKGPAGSSIASLSQLGLSPDQITVSEGIYHQPIKVNAWGNGQAPADEQIFAIDATKVTSSDGSLDGDANGAFGGNYAVVGTTVNKFFRHFGDGNGTGLVDLLDFSAVRSAFNQPSSVFDFDNNGNVDLLDFAEFRKRFFV